MPKAPTRQISHDWEVRHIKKLRDNIRKTRTSALSPEFPLVYTLPGSIERTLIRARGLCKPNDDAPLTRSEVIAGLRKLCAHAVRALGKEPSEVYRLAVLSRCYSRALLRPPAGTPVLTRSAFRWLLAELERQFDRAIVSPGEAVGCVSAQSVGEPATQMTLNLFHFAGIASKNVLQGVPRLQELFDKLKNIKTPSLSLFASSNQDVQCLARSLPEARLSEFLIEHDALQEHPHPNRFDRLWDSICCPPQNTSIAWWTVFLDGTRLSSRAILPRTLLEEIRAWIDCSQCQVRLDDATRFQSGVCVRLYLGLCAKTLEALAAMCPPETSQVRMIRELCRLLVQSVRVGGIGGVQAASVRDIRISREDPETRTLSTETVQIIDTQGTNLQGALVWPGIEWQRIYSNDINEMFGVFGLEASAESLFYELRSVMNADGGYVDDRHIALLVDTMTRWGHIMPLNRHGMNVVPTGFLGRCSFEKATDVILDAAAFHEYDDMRGVSQSIMVGQQTTLVGTGTVHVQPDPKMLFEKRRDIPLGGCQQVSGLLSYHASGATENSPKTKRCSSPPRLQKASLFKLLTKSTTPIPSPSPLEDSFEEDSPNRRDLIQRTQRILDSAMAAIDTHSGQPEGSRRFKHSRSTQRTPSRTHSSRSTQETRIDWYWKATGPRYSRGADARNSEQPRQISSDSNALRMRFFTPQDQRPSNANWEPISPTNQEGFPLFCNTTDPASEFTPYSPPLATLHTQIQQ